MLAQPFPPGTEIINGVRNRSTASPRPNQAALAAGVAGQYRP